MKNIKWIYSIIKSIKFLFLFVIIIYLLGTITSLAITGMQKVIIDSVFVSQQYELLPSLLIIFSILIIIDVVLDTTIPTYLFVMVFRIRKSLFNLAMTRLYNIPMETFRNQRIAKYTDTLTNKTWSISFNIGLEIPDLLVAVFRAIALMFIVWIMSPLMLLLLIILSVIYVVVGRYYAPKLHMVATKVRESRNDLLVHIEEGISSTREVIAYNRNGWEMENYNRLFNKYFKKVLEEIRLDNKQKNFSRPVKWGANIIVLSYGGFQVIDHSMSIGTFVVIYQFSTQLMDSINQVFDLVMGFPSKMTEIDQVRELFPSDQKPVFKTKKLSGPIENINFCNLSFGYEDNNRIILNELNLSIIAGSKIALVGKSGGGKSTLSQLLIRFISPQKGEVLINGCNLNEIDRNLWTKRVSVVFQETYFFPDTIHNNLILGRDNITEEQLVEACKITEIYDLILSLPHGFNTIIGERGISLSGGQKQRLALARGVLTNPEILILDEATSALDQETERRVQSNIDYVRIGLTTIIIAHRLSTVLNADCIYVLDSGKVVEYGTHYQPLENGDIYNMLIQSQNSDY